MSTSAESILTAYYQAFNAADAEGMLALLSEDVAHDLNQGPRQVGRDAFRTFLAHMARCYREQLRDLVIFASADGTRAAAEFIVEGTYLATDTTLPEATGQTYTLPAGAFFSLEAGKISRVTMYYNLEDWLRQVGAAPASS